ncbi:MAG: zinc-ribbon domain-containing protein [Erysipelotrichaceae bacterium]|jgi:RNA polymerase subunit RPABC4/transcription elongation factor Spt4|nr:zinc-ribbon domain-containing protein [Erysipelotrichaceae bacterium]
MKTCPYCKKKVDDDSKFCPFCGRNLTKVTKQAIALSEEETKIKNRIQALANLALIVFFGGLIICDWLLNVLLGAMNISTKGPIYLSCAVYLVAGAIALLAIYQYFLVKKKGIAVENHELVVPLGVLSVIVLVLLINISGVLMG